MLSFLWWDRKSRDDASHFRETINRLRRYKFNGTAQGAIQNLEYILDQLETGYLSGGE